MAGPSDQDKLSDDWGLEDIGSADASVAPVDESEMSEEERAAAAAGRRDGSAHGRSNCRPARETARRPGRPRPVPATWRRSGPPPPERPAPAAENGSAPALPKAWCRPERQCRDRPAPPAPPAGRAQRPAASDRPAPARSRHRPSQPPPEAARQGQEWWRQSGSRSKSLSCLTSI